MPRISLTGFRDPVRRPRYIIWTTVVLMMFIAVTIVALGITSTRWFCANGCHKVQDDTIIAYQHSSHSEISCMACHMPVNAGAVTFMLHKVEALGELYLTVTDKYELPLNAHSHVAEEMEPEQCTQCHSKNRKITASDGIIIDHEVHAKNGVSCTTCHNRVAHLEDFEMTLTHPKTGEKNHKHEDFMKMEACFRCHGLEADSKAPGRCATCHPADFRLKPENHLQEGFFPKGHASMAKEKPEYCTMCHEKAKFCDTCHGMQIPHPAAFKTPEKADDPNGHPAISRSKTKLAKCEFCHHQSKTKFCDTCHHKGFVKEVPWQVQHGKTVLKEGTGLCLEKCHKVGFCSACHAKAQPFPASHKAGDWVHRRSPGAFAKHSESAKKEIQACEICHGSGGVNASFCRGCHKLEMPHTDQFKQFHASTGKKSPAVCSNCHQFRELCSNCHHEGSSNASPWLQIHPKTVSSKGAAGCLEKCHKKTDCVACHQKTKALPASHKAQGWTRRVVLDKKALHTQAFDKQAENCTYCHGDGGAAAQFCNSCHKLSMPHPADFKDTHKPEFRAKKITKPMCANCHVQPFCDRCHHTGSSPRLPWVDMKGNRSVHDDVVKKSGAQPCFKCHEETYCSYCHVRISR